MDIYGDCAYCGGPTEPLGSLGIAHYTRCVSCGAEHVEYVTPEKPRRREREAMSDNELVNKPHIARALRAIDRYGEDEG